MDKKIADVDMLYELGELRNIVRYFQYSQGASSVAEHTLRVCYIATILAKREGADVFKTLQIALFHDAAEVRTGDAHVWQKPYVTLHTERAVRDMFEPTTLADVIPLIMEYEERGSLEAKIVKDADVIECEMEMRELKEMGSKFHSFFEEHGDTQYIYDKLRTESGRALYKTVCERRPLDRCLVANNSIKNGKHGS